MKQNASTRESTSSDEVVIRRCEFVYSAHGACGDLCVGHACTGHANKPCGVCGGTAIKECMLPSVYGVPCGMPVCKACDESAWTQYRIDGVHERHTKEPFSYTI